MSKVDNCYSTTLFNECFDEIVPMLPTAKDINFGKILEICRGQGVNIRHEIISKDYYPLLECLPSNIYSNSF